MDPRYIAQLITEDIYTNNGKPFDIYRYCYLLEDIEQQLPYLIKDLVQKVGSKEEAEEIIRELAELDPTTEKSFVGTFIKWINDNSLNYPEDKPRLKQAILDYQELREKFSVPKITKFNKLQDLEALADKKLRPEFVKKEKRKSKIDSLSDDVFYNDGELAAIKVTDPEIAVKLSSGTKWCTSKLEKAVEYLNDDPLYIVFRNGKKFAQFFIPNSEYMNTRNEELDDDVAYNIIDRIGLKSEILKHPNAAFGYVRNVIKGRWPEAEPIIMKDPHNAVSYASDVIKGRWPEAEPIIMKNPYAALSYAGDVIKGRWPEAEPIIMRVPHIAVLYAKDVIKGRWPDAEPIIKKEPYAASDYARDVIKGRWPKAEPIIMRNIHAAILYARDVIKGRWPKAEPIIMKDPNKAALYARDVIKGHWPEAEPIIMKDPDAASIYARDVIKGRWLEAEPYIWKDPEAAGWYIEHVYEKYHNSSTSK